MKLPKKLDISFNEFGIDERISDYITDLYGFCHNGFDLDIDENGIHLSNIDWDTEE